MQIITIYDFLLLPVYLLIFFYIVKRKANSLQTPELRKHYLAAFGLRMLGSVAYSMIVQYYYGYGDSFTYYKGSDFIHEQLVKNIDNIKYFFTSSAEFQNWYNIEEGDIGFSGYTANAANNSVMKIAAVLSFFTFNKFVIISLFFGFFSFAGQWRLFEVFNDYNKGRNQTLMAYAVLYSPSIWFWGSGLMKDSLCLGAAGFIINILYTSFIKKEVSLKRLLALPVFVVLLYTVKSYIMVIIAVSLALTLFVQYLFYIKSRLWRIVVIIMFTGSITGLLFLADFSNALTSIVEETYIQIQTFSQNYEAAKDEDERSRATIELGNLDASLSGLLIKSPEKIFTTLFRPFLWESKKVVILFTSLESTLLLLCTIYLLIQTNFIGFFRICFSNSLALLSFLVCILFALIIGFTTFNFGTMIRYKIILMPFYYFLLVYVYTNIKALKMPANK